MYKVQVQVPVTVDIPESIEGGVAPALSVAAGGNARDRLVMDGVLIPQTEVVPQVGEKSNQRIGGWWHTTPVGPLPHAYARSAPLPRLRTDRAQTPTVNLHGAHQSARKAPQPRVIDVAIN